MNSGLPGIAPSTTSASERIVHSIPSDLMDARFERRIAGETPVTEPARHNEQASASES